MIGFVLKNLKDMMYVNMFLKGCKHEKLLTDIITKQLFYYLTDPKLYLYF